MKLGVIGCGKMGSALLGGVLEAGVLSKDDVFVSDAVPAAAEAAGAKFGVTVGDTGSVTGQCDAVVLCVKPADVAGLLKAQQAALDGKLVLSIVAGKTLADLESMLPSATRVIRVMPNTPAQVGKGATAFSRGRAATPEDAAFAERIFGAVGMVAEVKEELMDAVTGLSGSGPAYVYMMIDALADGGVMAGLPRDLALRLASHTVAGAAEMVSVTGLHPATLKDMVASPGGTTIAGLGALEAAGFRAAIIGAVRAASERSKELGRRAS